MRWEDKDQDMIAQEYEELYDHYDAALRNLQDPRTVPTSHPDGKEYRLFDRSGKKVPRRTAIFSPEGGDRRFCGPLISFQHVQELFPDPVVDMDVMDTTTGNVQKRTEIFYYPQAFSRIYGHIQVNRVMGIHDNVINDINEEYHRRLVANEEEEDQTVDFIQPALEGISCQVYSELTHRAAVRAGSHECMQGTVTSALAGVIAESTQEKRMAQRKFDLCRIRRPFQRFQEKIQANDCPRDLRCESVLTINVKSLPHEDRSYRCETVFVC
jgi:hypothetical protein